MFRLKSFEPAMQGEVNEFFAAVFRESGKSFEPDGRHRAFADISGSFMAFWCMLEEDKIIGTVAVKRLSKTECELKGLYVYEKYHGRGLGRSLAETAVKFAEGCGFGKMFLDTMVKHEKALRLYEKMGFICTERYNDNERAEVFMVKELGNIKIREITDEDFDGLMRLYMELHNNPFPERDEYVMSVWKRIIDDKDHHIIVAEVGGVIAASCVCVIIPNLTRGQRPYAFIENVVTSEPYRRRGLASACLNYARELAGKENCYKMMLLTGSKEKSVLDFYENAGYNSKDKTAFIQWL